MNKLLIFLIITAAVFLLFSDVALARALENTYPQIPLPLPGGIENVSLNDIAAGENTLTFLILYFYTLSVIVVGLVAFGAIIMAGLKLLTAGANPGARADAKRRLQAAITGVALLLGSWLILNTINPELVQINVPQIEEGGFALNLPRITPVDIDLESLQYGGVVLYGNDNINGSSGKSEVVLNDIENFDNATWIKNNLSAIRITGECNITLFSSAGFSGTPWRLAGPTEGTFASLGFGDNEPSSLRFDKRDCLGNSVTVYRDNDYRRDSMPAIYDDVRIRGDVLRPSLPSTHADNEIDSIKFARPDRENLIVKLCEHKEFGGICAEISNDTPNIGEVQEKLHDAISSTSFGGDGKNRQAGVILYNKDNYGGVSETFISSDANIDAGNIVNRNSPTREAGGESTSSLRIIGKYKITIYDGPSFAGEEIEIDNTTSPPTFSALPGGRTETDYVSGNVIQIPALSEFSHPDGNWNDKVESIRIELP